MRQFLYQTAIWRRQGGINIKMLFKSEIDIIKGGIPYENVTKLWKSSVPYLSEYTRFDI